MSAACLAVRNKAKSRRGRGRRGPGPCTNKPNRPKQGTEAVSGGMGFGDGGGASRVPLREPIVRHRLDAPLRETNPIGKTECVKRTQFLDCGFRIVDWGQTHRLRLAQGNHAKRTQSWPARAAGASRPCETKPISTTPVPARRTCKTKPIPRRGGGTVPEGRRSGILYKRTQFGQGGGPAGSGRAETCGTNPICADQGDAPELESAKSCELHPRHEQQVHRLFMLS